MRTESLKETVERLALHNIALVQARRDPRARAYLERKEAQGMSRREALRCLKRQLANVRLRNHGS